MGTCTAELHLNFYLRLKEDFAHIINITTNDDLDFVMKSEDKILLAYIETSLLPDGYHGNQEVSVVDGEVRFKRWHDA